MTSTNKNNFGAGDAPLRRFLPSRGQNNNDSDTTTSSHTGTLEGVPSRPKHSTQRRHRCSKGFRTYYSARGTAKHGPRKGSYSSSHSKRVTKYPGPRIEGHCRCGAKVAPYDLKRCEDCFADDSAIFSGKCKSVVLF